MCHEEPLVDGEVGVGPDIDSFSCVLSTYPFKHLFGVCKSPAILSNCIARVP